MIPSPMKPTFIFRSLREMFIPDRCRFVAPDYPGIRFVAGVLLGRGPTLTALHSALGEPAQAFLGLALRLVLAADPAVVADVVEMAEQERVIDFTGSRLVAARIVGKLDMGDPGQVLLDRAGEIAFHDLHVIDVVLDEDIVRAG